MFALACPSDFPSPSSSYIFNQEHQCLIRHIPFPQTSLHTTPPLPIPKNRNQACTFNPQVLTSPSVSSLLDAQISGHHINIQNTHKLHNPLYTLPYTPFDAIRRAPSSQPSSQTLTYLPTYPPSNIFSAFTARRNPETNILMDFETRRLDRYALENCLGVVYEGFGSWDFLGWMDGWIVRVREVKVVWRR